MPDVYIRQVSDACHSRRVVPMVVEAVTNTISIDLCFFVSVPLWVVADQQISQVTVTPAVGPMLLTTNGFRICPQSELVLPLLGSTQGCEPSSERLRLVTTDRDCYTM